MVYPSQMIEVNIREAETNLTLLLQRVSEGEEVIIEADGKPVARLVRAGRQRPKWQLGSDAGKGWIAPDFDAPLPDDLIAAFEGNQE
jgi:prevent-host-death family protein